MGKFRLSRRAVLRGAGGIAIALPWLEIMQPTRAAHATAATPAKRFLHVYTPGGTVLGKWTPTGTETAPVLSPILKPLEALKSKILLVGGMDMVSAVGEQHQAGIIALLTGTSQSTTGGKYSLGPSIDQVLAAKLSAGKKKASIQAAIRWATGKSHGLLSPINSLNFEAAAPYRPIPPRLDPQEIWKDLFTNLTPGATTPTPAELHRKSILDFVDKKYNTLLSKVGAADKQKVEQHLAKIREIEQGLAVVNTTNVACKAPTLVATSDYNPTSGKNSSDDGSAKDTSTDAAIPKVGKLMTDMLVMALACDLTGVATLQWTDTEAKHTFPWLSLSEHHHFYQHDGGFKPNECEKICTWYSEQHAYLLQSMQAVDMGGGVSLLDESVVFFGSELQDPPSHGKKSMPFMLAGNGGGLRTGRYVQHRGVSHNNLLVAILNLFGDTRTTFGEARFCTGAVAGLV